MGRFILAFPTIFLLFSAPFSPVVVSETDEGKVLIDFKNSLAYNGGFLSSWVSTESQCKWDGIGCNDQSKISSIDISNNGLSGNLPSSISTLSSLESLVLSKNSFHGTIPSELGVLSNLKILKLDYNTFSGSIPSQLGQLTNLEVLLLNNNQLSGQVPQSLLSISSLTKLSLGNNSFS